MDLDRYQLRTIEHKVICETCVVDSYLAGIVKRDGVRQKCSYCEKQKTSADVNILIGQILSAVLQYYTDAQDSDCSWENWPEGMSTDDVVEDFNFHWPDDFVADVIDSIGHDYGWVSHVYGSVSQEPLNQLLADSWERFASTSNTIKGIFS